MGEDFLERVFTVEETASTVDGEEGGYFGFGSFDFPWGEVIGWEIARRRRISPVTLEGETTSNYGGV